MKDEWGEAGSQLQRWPRAWTLVGFLVYVEPVTSSSASPRTASQIDDISPSFELLASERDPPDTIVAKLCVVGAPVSEELHASVSGLEKALQEVRLAHEGAERRLRRQRDHVDDDLAAALAACRRLEEEKLAALSVAVGSDAEIFQDEPSAPAEALTLKSLRERYRTQIEALGADFSAQLKAQKLELSKQYFAEVQELSTASAHSAEKQAQQWRAKDAERAAELDALQRDITAGTAAFEASQREISSRIVEDAALRHQIAMLRSDLHVVRTELSAAYTRIHLLLSSSSWRASRPLRGVGRVLRRLKGR